MNFACTESSVKSAKNWLKRLKMVAEFSHRVSYNVTAKYANVYYGGNSRKNVTMSVSLIIGEIQI